MNITLTKEQLAPAVKHLSMVMNKKTTLPILECVECSATKETVSLRVTNLEEELTYRIPRAFVQEEGVAVFSFDALQSAAKILRKDERVSLSTDDTDITRVLGTKRGDLQAQFPLLDREEFPVPGLHRGDVPGDVPELCKANIGEFIENYRLVSQCCSTDETRQPLLGVFVDEECIVATDGRRLMTAAHSLRQHGVIIPCTKFLQKGVLAGKGEIGMDTEQFVLVTDVFTYVTRNIPATYANYKRVIPDAQDMTASATLTDASVETLKMLLELLPKDDEDNRIDIMIECGRVVLGAETAGAYNTVCLPDAVSRGTDRCLSVNGKFLVTILDSGFRIMGQGDGHAPLRFETDTGRAVIMPLCGDNGPRSTEPYKDKVDALWACLKDAPAQTTALF